VLNALEVTDHFQAIIDIYAIAPHCKPQPEAFQKALDQVGQRPEHCLLIDDTPANLAAAQQLGIKTISVGAHPHDGSPHFADIHAFLSQLDHSFK
jgi:putative hydrolase of the HAD superfamily